MSDVELKLTPEELAPLTESHRKTQELIFALGQLEMSRDALDQRKGTLISQIRELNVSAQKLMAAASERLGIAPGTPWQMLPDGSVLLLDPKTGLPA